MLAFWAESFLRASGRAWALVVGESPGGFAVRLLIFAVISVITYRHQGRTAAKRLILSITVPLAATVTVFLLVFLTFFLFISPAEINRDQAAEITRLEGQIQELETPSPEPDLYILPRSIEPVMGEGKRAILVEFGCRSGSTFGTFVSMTVEGGYAAMDMGFGKPGLTGKQFDDLLGALHVQFDPWPKSPEFKTGIRGYSISPQESFYVYFEGEQTSGVTDVIFLPDWRDHDTLTGSDLIEQGTTFEKLAP